MGVAAISAVHQLAPLRPLSGLENANRSAGALRLHLLHGTPSHSPDILTAPGSHEAAAGGSALSPGALHRAAGGLPGGWVHYDVDVACEASGGSARALCFRRGGPTPRGALGEASWVGVEFFL